MPVTINFKICDNAKECSGIAVCPTGALGWDEENLTIVIDNTLCTSCGQCEQACMVHAIRVGQDDQEMAIIRVEIEADPRQVSDLFVDRYGAVPIDPAFVWAINQIKPEEIETQKLVVIEAYNEDSIRCLLPSISIRELFAGQDIKYRKLELTDITINKLYDIQKLPTLLFFHHGQLVGKIEGYYDQAQVADLQKQINPVLNNL